MFLFFCLFCCCWVVDFLWVIGFVCGRFYGSLCYFSFCPLGDAQFRVLLWLRVKWGVG